MRHLTEELYKKMQLFQLPLEADMTMEQLAEEFDIEADEFLLQELLARDEWYDKYLPEPLHSRLFDEHGEVSFQELDDTLLDDIGLFRADVEQQWAQAMAQVQQEKQQLEQLADSALRALLQLDISDSEIRKVTGIDSDTVTIELYPQWDMGKIVTLRFTQVKDSWMSRMHPDDANWWLLDEIAADEEREGRYGLYVLFGNADFVGQIQLSFAGVEITEREDPLGF